MTVMVITGANQVGLRFVAATVFTLVVPSTGLACVELVAELPEGPVRAIDFDGDLAVVGAGRVLKTVDLSVPGTPVEFGELVLPGVIHGVALSGDHAYVAAGAQGLFVVAVSDPAAPEIVGSYDFDDHEFPTSARDVAVIGSIAFVAESVNNGSLSGGVEVIDVSLLEEPVSLGFSWGDGSSRAIAATSDRVFLACRGGVSVYDSSDPEELVELPGLWPTANASDVAVEGDRVVVARYGGDYLRVFDMASPEYPGAISETGYAGTYARSVALDGAHAYAASDHYYGRLQIFDLTDTEHPVSLGYENLRNATGVAAGDGLVLVGANHRGMRIIDASDPVDPTEIAAIQTVGETFAVTVSQDLVLTLSEWPDGQRLVDVSDPTAPRLAGFLPAPETYAEAVISGDRAFVPALVDDLGGIVVFDISDPFAPTEVGSASLMDSPAAMIPVESMLATIIHTGTSSFVGFAILDIRDLENPSVLGSVELTGGTPRSLAVEEGFAFVGVQGYPWAYPGFYSSLQIVDISEPSSPVVVGEMRGYFTAGVAVRDGLVYLAGGNRLQVVDPGDPVNPEIVSSIELMGSAESLVLGRRAAFVATTKGLEIVDIHNPDQLNHLGIVETPGVAKDLAISGHHVYVADGEAGLAVFDVSACGLPTPRRSSGRVTP
jgi:hypothetical protein